MTDAPLWINYFGGCYGNFVEKFLKEDLSKTDGWVDRIDFHYHSIPATFEIYKTHNNENISDTRNLKITYEKKHVNLIARNVWTKEPKHLEEKARELFAGDQVSMEDKKIITMAFYNSTLLDKAESWNRLLKQTTIALPFEYFFCSVQDWTVNWRKIFNKLMINVDDEYLAHGHRVFNITQQTILTQHDYFNILPWKDQDLIGKGNLLGELYFKKHVQNRVPIDIKKYKNTVYMLIDFIKILDNQGHT